jgi:hypothetical protein
MSRYVRAYFYNLGVAASQLANVMLLAGDPDESLSGRIGKGLAANRWWARAFRLWPAFARHCMASVEAEEGGASAAKRQEFP